MQYLGGVGRRIRSSQSSLATEQGFREPSGEYDCVPWYLWVEQGLGKMIESRLCLHLVSLMHLSSCTRQWKKRDRAGVLDDRMQLLFMY